MFWRSLVDDSESEFPTSKHVVSFFTGSGTIEIDLRNKKEKPSGAETASLWVLIKVLALL